jgi:hypothetical protein
MGNKDYILRKIKELEEARKHRKRLERLDDSYRPRSMVVRMPFGCWIVIAAIVLLLFFGLKSMLK